MTSSNHDEMRTAFAGALRHRERVANLYRTVAGLDGSNPLLGGTGLEAVTSLDRARLQLRLLRLGWVRRKTNT